MRSGKASSLVLNTGGPPMNSESRGAGVPAMGAAITGWFG